MHCRRAEWASNIPRGRLPPWLQKALEHKLRAQGVVLNCRN